MNSEEGSSERSGRPAQTEREAQPARVEELWETVFSRDNLNRALQRVENNKGAPGVDAMTVAELRPWLRVHGPEVRAKLEAGTYRPAPVRRVSIPKPEGGERELGVPTVLDRLIQQAIAQALVPVFDPHFSERSYGFRPGRSAGQAVQQARGYMSAGLEWVVDVDLERFLGSSTHYPCRSSRLSNRVASESGGSFGSSIRRPFRLPERRCRARNSPRFTRCKTVCLETPNTFIASHMVTHPGGASSTNCDFRSSLIRMCQGAPGVGCSARMKPSPIQRCRVEGAMPRTLAALAIGSSSQSSRSASGWPPRR